MLEEIAKSRDLSFFFVGDRDGLVATLKQGAEPVMQSAKLLGEIGVEELHERSELLLRVGDDEKMIVVREEDTQNDPKAGVALARPRVPLIVRFTCDEGRMRNRP